MKILKREYQDSSLVIIELEGDEKRLFYNFVQASLQDRGLLAANSYMKTEELRFGSQLSEQFVEATAHEEASDNGK